MAQEKERVGEMNEVIVEYMQRLGVSDAAKTEFSTKANAMKAMAGHESAVWFHAFITQLHHTLSKITAQSKPLHIDLNLPLTEAGNGAIEDEEREVGSEAMLMIRVHNSSSP